MEAAVWLTLGALAGLTASLAFRSVGRLGVLGGMTLGATIGLVSGLAADALVGDLATLRMSVASSGARASVSFGVVPALAAISCATTALTPLERLSRRSTTREDEAGIARGAAG